MGNRFREMKSEPMNTLSKREQIAAMAMQGLLANTKFLTRVLDDPTRSPGEGFTDGEIVARVAAHMTDALLAELERTTPQPACEWKEDEDGNWDTGCGNTFSFDEGGPEENKSKFCCYCGKGVKAVKFRDRIEKQPDPDGWIPHTPGDPMPCEASAKVSVRLAGGHLETANAGDFLWGPTGYPKGEITHWKLA